MMNFNDVDGDENDDDDDGTRKPCYRMPDTFLPTAVASHQAKYCFFFCCCCFSSAADDGALAAASLTASVYLRLCYKDDEMTIMMARW